MLIQKVFSVNQNVWQKLNLASFFFNCDAPHLLPKKVS